VQEALAQGCNVGFKTAEYHACERMLHVFQEEKRLEGVFSILNTQNPHECFAQFNEAVAAADDIQMNTHSSNRARELLAEAVAYRQQLDAEAGEQVQRLEEPNMKSVLERADAIGYSTDHLEKIRSLLYDTAEDAFVKLQLSQNNITRSRIARSVEFRCMLHASALIVCVVALLAWCRVVFFLFFFQRPLFSSRIASV
jgi:hypothetical protein